MSGDGNDLRVTVAIATFLGFESILASCNFCILAITFRVEFQCTSSLTNVMLDRLGGSGGFLHG